MTEPVRTPATDSPAPHERRRRALLVGGVSTLAVLAGAGLAWWRTAQTPPTAQTANNPDAAGGGPTDPQAPVKSSSIAIGEVPAHLWAMSFDAPGGGSLALSSLRGRPLLINFWATWCPPCVEEMPLLDAFYRDNAAYGWQVIGLAVDQPSAVQTFLAQRPVTFPIGLAGLQGTDLSRSLGNPKGGLPFSVVLRADGVLAATKLGQLSAAELSAWKSLA